MSAHPVRSAALFTGALVLLSGGAYVVQQTAFEVPPPSASAIEAVAAPDTAGPAPTTASTRQRHRDGAVTSALPVVSTTWLDRTAAAAGIPVPAVRAYARAQLLAAPSCHLGWTTLAGVGWIESQHGTLGGRTLDDDGLASSPIIGPALDGSHHTQAIAADAAGTGLHGDTRWEHAVGPLQFLPDTWAVWGVDGDGDGRVDPQDLDDAARAAADYLCADGHDLATDQGWTDAVLSYNHDAGYLAAVHDAAETYAARTSG